MKKYLLVALSAMALGAFAQAPATSSAPKSQVNNASEAGGMAADKAQMKTDAKKDGMPMASGSSMGWKAMDTNGDGMVSKAEWDAYHGGRWKKMKQTKGKVNMTEMEAMMSGGP